MKKRLLSGLLALCLLAFCLPVTGQGAEASLEELKSGRILEHLEKWLRAQ